MFPRVTMPTEYDKATHYDLGGGRFARVILTVTLAKPDRAEIEAQAFQVDQQGNLVPGPNGIASRTAGTNHVLALSGVAAQTHTLKPGWIRAHGEFSEETVGEEVTRVTEKPTEPGQLDEERFQANPGWMWRYDMGDLERIRQDKCEALLTTIEQSDVLAGLADQLL